MDKGPNYRFLSKKKWPACMIEMFIVVDHQKNVNKCENLK